MNSNLTKKKNEEIHYYDLDGTLSSLNSTFDFIKAYLKDRKKLFRLFLVKVIMSFLVRARLYHPYKSRYFVINLLFKGLKKEDLEQYYHETYKEMFLSSLTSLGEKVIKRDNSNDILITGCTQIPAELIGKLFGFKEVISTEFNYKNGRIQNIKHDTYGSLKINFVQKKSQKMIYYTDDLQSEKSLINIMDRIIEV